MKVPTLQIFRSRNIRCAVVACTLPFLLGGCKKTSDNTLNYRNAINTYLNQNQSCLWPQPQQFPVQLNTGSDKTTGFDALYNQGLLNRTTGDKKQLLGLVSKQVTNYDLSDKGRSSWTASQTDPSTGNFCYGHREVSSIDNSTATGDQLGATASIQYHYGFSSPPSWAKDGGVQNAFPNLQANLAGGQDTATLVDTNNGWRVQVPARSNVSNSDGSIVQ